jgi:hypothetical protein
VLEILDDYLCKELEIKPAERNRWREEVDFEGAWTQ